MPTLWKTYGYLICRFRFCCKSKGRNMKEYLKKNIIPVVIEICFIVSCFIVPHEYFIYTNFIFYLCLFMYFCITKAFSFKEWLVQVKSGKRFWKQVVLTAIMFLIAFVVTIVLEGQFSTLTTGYINLKRDTWLRLFVFAISTTFLLSGSV